MRRREFITLLGGTVAAWPLAAHSQQPGSVRRVGVLMNSNETNPEFNAYLAAFVQGLRNLGWIDGQNLRLDLRWVGGDADRARISATELLRLSPDVILSSSTINLTALLRQAPTMPIVFVQVSDPVAQGFISNLARPEGNITGFSSYEFSIGGKWVDLLKQMAPSLVRVSLMFNPDTSPQSKFFLSSVEAVRSSLGVEVIAAPVHNTADIERAIETLSRQPNGGLILTTDSFLQLHSKLIVDQTARHRVPAIYNERNFTAIGGLMSYGIDYDSIFRQAAIYIDRILKGVKPVGLPVQGPTKFTLIINVTAAKALGIEVPTSLLLRADEYIE
jgi:putative tryptophan/tyrosine transport system substrate-binding protein